MNADLATLSDTDPSSGSDTITLTAKDSFGNSAQQQTIAVTASGLPVLTAPSTATVALNQATKITGVSLAESGSTSDETFTVTLSDGQGKLSATTSAEGGGGSISGSGTTSLTITGTLSQVNADLATLSDTDPSSGSDTITLTAKDSFGNSAQQQTIAVTASGLPVLTAPSTATVALNQATKISGVSLSESGSTSDETFTVTLSDGQGKLSATTSAEGGGGSISGSGTTSLTITGTLSQVNADLATLSDTDPSSGSDTITLTAKDSFGNSAQQQTIAVTASPNLTIAINAVGKVTAAQAENGFSISGTVTGQDVNVTVNLGFGDLKATVTGNSWSVFEPYDLAAGTFTITATASDGLGDSASAAPQQFSVPDTGDNDDDDVHPLALTVPGAQTLQQNSPTAITGVSLAGSVTSDEILSVTLTDSHGLLSASGNGVSGSGSAKLTITGTLTQVNADLKTLSDSDGTTGSDTITLTASDSFGNQSAPQTIAVTVKGGPVGDHWDGSNADWNSKSHWSSGVPTGDTDAFIDAAGSYTVNISQSAVANTLTINDPSVTINDNVSLQLSGALTVTAGTFELNNGSLETQQISIAKSGTFLVGHGTQILSEAISNNGQFVVDGNGTVAHINGLLSGTGSFAVNSGSSLQFSADSNTIAGSITDNGTVELINGKLELAGTLSGTGVLQIDAGATLQLDGADSINVKFNGPTGDLVLKNPAAFAGTIIGLSGNDQIDLTNIASATAKVSSVSYSTSSKITTLTITDGHHSDTIKLQGNYTDSTWTFSDDGNGGTIVVDPPASSASVHAPAVEGAVVEHGSSSNHAPIDQLGINSGSASEPIHEYIGDFFAQVDGFEFVNEASPSRLNSSLGTESSNHSPVQAGVVDLQEFDGFDFQQLASVVHSDINKSSVALDEFLHGISSEAEQLVQASTSAQDHQGSFHIGSLPSGLADAILAHLHNHFIVHA